MSIFNEAIRNFLQPINELLDDESITEIMINGANEIFIERKGMVVKTNKSFRDEEDLLSALRAIAQSVGRTIDDENPRLDAYLKDGSRLCAVISPLSKKGTSVAIRKFSQSKLSLKDLISLSALSKDAARFLDVCVFLGKNILVAGGTGSGKTTILNVLGSRVPKGERIITIEDSLELQIHHDHLVNFVARKEDPNKNKSAISIRDLVHSAMRLRPDRIIIGEVRSDEALDLVQIMNTGHSGSMGTLHANNPYDACIRLELLCMLGQTQIPYELLRKMIAGAVQIIVQCHRYSDGKRRLSHISEVTGIDQRGDYAVKDIYKWIQKGRLEDGQLDGEMIPCGYLPSFFEDIAVNRIPFPREHFEIPAWATPGFKKAV
jgi:pilus assembly protein CpaF